MRYRRAREFVEVVRGLWDSWDDDAFVFDKADGRFYDPDRRHVLDHAGEFFKVRGPLTVSRSPQGQPVVVQAGASDDGRQLAAETAEVVFCAHQSIDGARQYYRDVKERMVRYGRDPGSSQGDARPRRHGRADPGGGARTNTRSCRTSSIPEVGVALLSKYLFFDLTRLRHRRPGPGGRAEAASRRARSS